MIKTINFVHENCLCSKMTLCTSRMQLWRLFTTFPPKTWHFFLLNNQKWLEKLFYKSDFTTKVQHFFVKFKYYGKKVTLFSGNPIFHQIIVCKGKMQFLQLWRHTCVKSVEILISSNLNWWKNFHLFKKIIIKIVLWRQKMKFRQECSKNVTNSQNIFGIKSKIVRTNRFFQESCLFFKIAPPCK